MEYIIEIDLDKGEKAYMKVSKEQKEKLVIINRENFLELWKGDPNFTELSHGDRGVWEKDRKYQDAAEGFSLGIRNPVPPANVTMLSHEVITPIYGKSLFFSKKILYNKKEKIEYLAINDGITRTIWLLSKGAKCFPVLDFDINSRKRLKKLAEYKDVQNYRFLDVEHMV
jgi:hypothetical protein